MPSIVITGCNRGLGLGFTRQFAERDWEVYALCREPESATDLQKTMEEYPRQISVYRVDVQDEKSIEEFTKKLGDTSLDCLLNNAGVYGADQASLENIDYDSWLEVIKTNVFGPLRMVQALRGALKKGKKKLLVTLSSKMGSIADNSSGGSYAYRTSKCAINMVMKNLAHELEPDGITCVTFHPGWVKTDMGGPNALIEVNESVSKMTDQIVKFTKKDNGKFLDFAGQTIPF